MPWRRRTLPGRLWLGVPDAEAGSLSPAKTPQATPTEEEPIRVPAGPPPEVVFSAPTQDETDVLLTATVRIQFSRDLDQATLKGRIKPHYLESQSAERGEPVTPSADFTFPYAAANRVLQPKFTNPPAVATGPLYPFKYKRSRHSTSNLT